MNISCIQDTTANSNTGSEYIITNTHTDNNTNTHYNVTPNSTTYIQWVTVLLGFLLLGIFYYCMITSILFFACAGCHQADT